MIGKSVFVEHRGIAEIGEKGVLKSEGEISTPGDKQECGSSRQYVTVSSRLGKIVRS